MNLTTSFIAKGKGHSLSVGRTFGSLIAELIDKLTYVKDKAACFGWPPSGNRHKQKPPIRSSTAGKENMFAH